MPDDHGDDFSVARLWRRVRCSFGFVVACEEAPHGPCSTHSSCPAFDKVVADKDVRKNELFSPSTEFIVSVFSDEELQDTPGKERDVALLETYTADSQLFREMNRAMREKDVATMRFFASFIKELARSCLTLRKQTGATNRWEPCVADHLISELMPDTLSPTAYTRQFLANRLGTEKNNRAFLGS